MTPKPSIASQIQKLTHKDATKLSKSGYRHSTLGCEIYQVACSQSSIALSARQILSDGRQIMKFGSSSMLHFMKVSRTSPGTPYLVRCTIFLHPLLAHENVILLLHALPSMSMFDSDWQWFNFGTQNTTIIQEYVAHTGLTHTRQKGTHRTIHDVIK